MARTKKTDPVIIEMPSQKMAVVTTVGDPNEAGESVFPQLYGTVYSLKFTLKKQGKTDFKVTGLRAKWPDAHIKPKDSWTGIWGLPVPNDTTELKGKLPSPKIELQTWEYGTVAQILHIGPYSEEGPTIQRLHEFIGANGYTIAGSHEEEYLTMPDVKEPKTIIRYPVRKK